MTDKPSYRGTRLRSVRIPDELWARARARAEEQDDSLSDVIRAALEAYASRK